MKWADLISVKRNRVAFAVAVIGGIWCHLNGTDCDPQKGEDQRVLHAPIRKSPAREREHEPRVNEEIGINRERKKKKTKEEIEEKGSQCFLFPPSCFCFGLKAKSERRLCVGTHRKSLESQVGRPRGTF